MANKYFDKDYAEYWKKRVDATADGSKVPDETVEKFFIDKVGIKSGDMLLDLGCGHGRLYPLLRQYTKHIEGIDLNEAALKDASIHPYAALAAGTAEHTNLQPDHFDHVIAWAVYDGAEQDQGLIEANRILKNGGHLLITGKNKDYEPGDLLAFIAERNAKLKNFPNHFTDVYGLMRNVELFGFKIIAGFGFRRRGDFGSMQFFDLKEDVQKFYEFLLILEKIGGPTVSSREICYEFSDTAKTFAREQGFDSVYEFFRWHKDHE